MTDIEPVDLDKLRRTVARHPPSEVEDKDGISDRDRAVAEVGRRARAAGNTAAITDPSDIARIRRGIARDLRPGPVRAAWRRVRRLIQRKGDAA